MSLLVTRTDDIRACRALRRAVFIDEQGIAEADEYDDLDSEAVHLLARADGLAVGTARLLLRPPVGKVGRVCTLASHRGTGIGRALMVTGIGILRDIGGIAEVRLGAQLSALEFYRQLGFAAVGPIYDDAGIPHRKMTLRL